MKESSAASLSSPVLQGTAALVCAECLAIKNNWEAGLLGNLPRVPVMI